MTDISMTGSLIQQKFGAAAADYASSAVHAKGESLARLFELVQPESHWRVLDVATGAGHTALAFAPQVSKVTACDITDAMLAETKRLAAERGVANIRTAHANAEDLPFPDTSFDLVTCRLAAHHFAKPAAFVAESFRVLMPGGCFALVDNIAPDDAALARAYNGYEKLRDPSHGRCLSLAEWQDLLTGAGFEITHAEVMNQEIAFAPWVGRMRCSDATIALLKTRLAEPPLCDMLRPKQTDAGLMFALREAIVVARKPA
jgi:ubiquinone/menaquinone biosynthesis C-methylase UbiE